MSKRENRATVKDETLSRSFAQGLNEGMRLVGYVTIFFNVGERIIKKQPTVAVADVQQVVSELLSELRAEHYEVGVSIRILSEGDITTEGTTAGDQQQELDDGIEDAEVVE